MSKLLSAFGDFTQDITDLLDKPFLIPAICSHMKNINHSVIVSAFVDAQFKSAKHKVYYLPDDFIKSVSVRELYCHKHNLMQTATGYGHKLVTRYIIKCADNKTRRVYASCHSNVSCLYLIIDDLRFYVNDYMIEVE